MTSTTEAIRDARARIEHALIALGWDDMEAERAAYISDPTGRWEDVARGSSQ